MTLPVWTSLSGNANFVFQQYCSVYFNDSIYVLFKCAFSNLWKWSHVSYLFSDTISWTFNPISIWDMLCLSVNDIKEEFAFILSIKQESNVIWRGLNYYTCKMPSDVFQHIPKSPTTCNDLSDFETCEAAVSSIAKLCADAFFLNSSVYDDLDDRDRLRTSWLLFTSRKIHRILFS